MESGPPFTTMGLHAASAFLKSHQYYALNSI